MHTPSKPANSLPHTLFASFRSFFARHFTNNSANPSLAALLVCSCVYLLLPSLGGPVPSLAWRLCSCVTCAAGFLLEPVLARARIVGPFVGFVTTIFLGTGLYVSVVSEQGIISTRYHFSAASPCRSALIVCVMALRSFSEGRSRLKTAVTLAYPILLLGSHIFFRGAALELLFGLSACLNAVLLGLVDSLPKLANSGNVKKDDTPRVLEPERERAKRRIEKSAMRAIETLGEGALLVSGGGVTGCNRVAKQLISKLRGDVHHQEIGANSPEDIKVALAMIRVVGEEGKSESLLDGVCDVSSMGPRKYKVLGPNNEATALTLILTSNIISSKRHISVCLISHQDPQTAPEHMERNFMAMVVHELRNSLNNVLGVFEILAGDLSPSELKEYCSIGANSAHMMMSFVNDILDMAQMSNGSFKFSVERADIRLAVREVLKLTTPMYSKKGVRLLCGELEVIPPFVDCDKTRYKQILINLLGNSLKFTPAAGSVTVRVDYDSVQRLVITRVTDTGKGIEKADIGKLFCMYRKLCTDAQTNPQGAGLGLFICKTLAENMGGHISVESEMGRGSTFIFSIKDQTPLNLETVEEGLPAQDLLLRPRSESKMSLLPHKASVPDFRPLLGLSEPTTAAVNSESPGTFVFRPKGRRCSDSANKLPLETGSGGLLIGTETSEMLAPKSGNWNRVFSAIFPKPMGDLAGGCDCAQILSVDDDYCSLCVLKKQFKILGYNSDIVSAAPSQYIGTIGSGEREAGFRQH